MVAPGLVAATSGNLGRFVHTKVIEATAVASTHGEVFPEKIFRTRISAICFQPTSCRVVVDAVFTSLLQFNAVVESIGILEC